VAIPTLGGLPETPCAVIAGESPFGESFTFEPAGSATDTLLAFISTDCIGCQQMVEAAQSHQDFGGPTVNLVFVGRDLAEEDGVALRQWATQLQSVPLVLSTKAFSDYGVRGGPFYVLAPAGGGKRLSEGVVIGVEQVAAEVRRARGFA